MKKRMGKKGRILMYSAFTVLLTCLVVTGYYLISNGVIFGKPAAKADTYKMGEVTATDPKKIAVTPQSQEKVVPLTSENTKLPVIPPTTDKDGKQAKKLTKENPFVVLEIVPELSQQSLAYLVDSEEKGLPFNPVEIGIKFCNESWNSSGFLDGSRQNILGQGDIKNELMQKGGYFYNELWDKIKNAKGEVVNYYEVKFLYEFKLYSSDMNLSEEDLKNKKVHELYEENKEAFALACPQYFSTSTDDAGNIASVSCQDRSFQFALNEKDKDGNYTDRNWVKTIEENKDVTKSYKFTIPAESGMTDADLALPMAELAQKFKDSFAADDNGSVVPADILAKDKKWVKNKTQQVKEFTKGYFVKVGKGAGQYTLTGYNPWTNDNMITAAKTGTDTDMWDYVESEVYPDASLEVSEYYKSEQHNIDNKLREEGDEGVYLKLTYTLHDENPWYIWQEGRYVHATSDVYTFDYAKYVYTFKYAGIKINELLKYALFERDKQEDYDKMNVQVITVTPEMINEMDANDKEDTLDYIERADLFYINEMYDGFDAVADGKELNIAINFYNKYCTESGKTIDVSDTSKIKTFYDTDLEWWDCVKIMKRLSTTRNLPMMMTKLVGSMGNNGVDGTTNVKMYVDENSRSVDTAGMLNNISKLQLITAQFDLVDSTVFTDTILPNIKVMELNEDQQDGSKFPAKYTGYYERIPLADDVSVSDDYKMRCYYLWNKFTFLPTGGLSDKMFPKRITDDDWGADGKVQGVIAELIEKYGFCEFFFWNYVSHKAYDTLYQNPNDIGSDQALPRIDGSDGNDMKNVTFVSNTQSNNINMGVLSEFTTNRMLDILKKILDNVDVTPDELDIKLQQNKKEYVKISDNQALLDYSSEADYRSETKDKIVNLKVTCPNLNNEDAVIRKLTLLKSADDKVDSGKDIDKIFQNKYNKDTEEFEYGEKKFEKVEEIENEDTGEKELIGGIRFSNGTEPLSGFRILAEDNTTSYYVPFKLSDWQKKYVVLRIDWTARLKIERRKVEYASKEGTSFIYIGERGLSNLE